MRSAALLPLLFALPEPTREAVAAPPLNVVIILMDDVGIDQVGVYESKYPPRPGQAVPHPVPCTPTMDRLAADGPLFTNAWSSADWSPTRSQVESSERLSRRLMRPQ